MEAIDQLINYNRTTGLLQSVAGRNAWDQETMMPSKSGNSVSYTHLRAHETV